MLTGILILIGVVVAVASWMLWGSHFVHRTELTLDTFELVAARERHWLGWRLAREVFVRPTYLTPAARATGARVLVDEHRPGVRGLHGIGKHLVQLMALREPAGARGFAAWSRQHPAETARMLRLFGDAVAGRGAEEAARRLRELLLVGMANEHATFAAEVDAHLP